MWRRLLALVVRFLSMVSLAAAVAASMLPALGGDLDGRYATSPLHDWFEHLASGQGLCCSFADGYAIADADWETKDGHYRVRLPKAINSNEMVWVDVPNDAVIKEPNKAGRTMVWPLYGYEGVTVRCFMPGALT
jgi:hypothetical protein